jgi:hypothetical protein
MKTIIALAVLLSVCSIAFAEIKWINSYQKSDGSTTSGHYRDTSNDGVQTNNANYLGYNK